MKLQALLSGAFLFLGCASTYNNMHLDSFEYEKGRDSSAVQVEYCYNALNKSENTLYDEKARLQGVDVVAVKLKNNTGKEIDVKRDLDFYVGANQSTPRAATEALAYVRQRSGLYAWWLLLMLVNGFKTETTCNGYGCSEDSQFIPIGIILGPVIALINIGMASSANDGIIKDVSSNDLSHKVLKPGETATGYLVFDVAGNAPISAKLRP